MNENPSSDVNKKKYTQPKKYRYKILHVMIEIFY